MDILNFQVCFINIRILFFFLKNLKIVFFFLSMFLLKVLEDPWNRIGKGFTIQIVVEQPKISSSNDGVSLSDNFKPLSIGDDSFETSNHPIDSIPVYFKQSMLENPWML